MDTKITLTLYDVVSHFVPGTALLLSFHYFSGIGKTIKATELIIYLLVFGYITGLLLHLIGLLLFRPFFIADHSAGTWKHSAVKLCDAIVAWTLPLKVKKLDTAAAISEELTTAIHKKLNIQVAGDRLSFFSVADTYVASLAFTERDILSAKEGVFRSLAVLIIVEAIYLSIFVFPNYKLAILAGAVILVELCRYGREYYRTIKNQQIYTLALIKLKQD